MRRKNPLRMLAALLLCAVLFSTLFAALPLSVSASAAGSSTTAEAAVSENGQYIEVTCALSEELLSAASGETLYLFAIQPQQRDTPLSQLTPAKEGIVPQRSVTLQLAAEGNLYSAFVLAASDTEGGFTELCSRVYVTNYGVLAKRTYDYPTVYTKKGLDVSLFTDAQLLGSEHTVITLPINEYLCAYSESAVAYQYGSGTYYFDSTKISLLDHRIKIYSDAGMRVYLNLVLTEKTSSMPESLGCLYYDNAAPGAEFYAVNTSSSDAVGYLRAAVDFLVSRYTKPERTHGFCGSIIFGYEVNSNRNTNNAGSRALSEYVGDYIRAFRIVEAAARSVYSNARVYTSLANNYTVPSKASDADATLDYSARDFLDMFAASVADGGDLPWRLAINPYNSSLSDALFTDGSQTDDYITMNNINTLTLYLSGSRFLYGGQRRSILISEIGYTSGDNSDTAQKRQAAAFACAYYRAQANDMIEAIIWHSQVDSSTEQACLGLWTRDAGTQGIPNVKKDVYNVFKYIDTSSSRAVCGAYLPVLGFSSWGEAVSGYDSSSLSVRTELTGTGTTTASDAGSLYSQVMFGFKSDSEGFYPSDNCGAVIVGSDEGASNRYGSSAVLKAVCSDVVSCEYRGVSNACYEPLDLSDIKYIKLSAAVVSEVSMTSADMLLILTGQDADGKALVYEGSAQLVPGDYYDLCFDISDFVAQGGGKADSIKIWVKPTSGTGELTLLLHEIASLSTKRANGASHVVKVVFIVILSVILLVALLLLVLYIRATYLDSRRKKRRAAMKNKKSGGRSIDLPPHKKNDTNDYDRY